MLEANVPQIATMYCFAGSLLDLACGTDMSQAMPTECRRLGLYEDFLVGRA